MMRPVQKTVLALCCFAAFTACSSSDKNDTPDASSMDAQTDSTTLDSGKQGDDAQVETDTGLESDATAVTDASLPVADSTVADSLVGDATPVDTAVAMDTQAVDSAPVIPLSLTSTSFKEGEAIPVHHTCDGDRISPPLAWDNVPAGTKSFALIVDDPDAPGGDFVHWVLFDIPASTTALPAFVRNIGISGVHSNGSNGYFALCPPSGTHHYHFKLYALSVATVGLVQGSNKAQLLAAMQGKILGQAELIGTYTRLNT